MEANEEYVRQRWVDRDNGRPYLEVFFNCFWNVWLDGDVFSFPQYKTESEAWQAAADFTRQREEEIRQVEEEIALLARYKESREQILNSPYLTGEWAKTGEPLREHVAIFKRILAREQAALADLRRGWKEHQS